MLPHDTTVRFIVAALSQLLLLLKCAVCDPLPVKVRPFHVKGNAVVHMVSKVADDVVWFTVRFNVAALSQPLPLLRCAVCELVPVNVRPFHEYGNCDEQIVVLVVDVLG